MVKTRTLGVVGLCAMFAVAIAATTKFSAFLPASPAGFTENPGVDGTGTLKFNSSTGYTRLHLQVSDLRCGTTYGIMLESDNGSVSDVAAFTTNPAGHGVFQSDTFGLGDLTVNPRLTIFIWDGVPDPDFLPQIVPLHTNDRADLDAFGQTRAEGVLR